MFTSKNNKTIPTSKNKWNQVFGNEKETQEPDSVVAIDSPSSSKHVLNFVKQVKHDHVLVQIKFWSLVTITDFDPLLLVMSQKTPIHHVPHLKLLPELHSRFMLQNSKPTNFCSTIFLHEKQISNPGAFLKTQLQKLTHSR